MKQVNLRELNIRELEFMFWINLTDDLLEKIKGLVAPDKDGDYVFGELYRINNVGHFVGAMVSKSVGEGRYRIHGMCKIVKGKRLEEGVVSVSKLFEILCSIEEEITAMNKLNLSFSRRQKRKAIISLPIKITDIPETVYDEIHGMHFVKREGKGFKYDVILDLERDGSITEIIIYNKRINIKESIFEDIAQAGIGISDRFVLRGQP
jgi:hypothetical protein